MASEHTYVRRIQKWQVTGAQWETYTKAALRAQKAKKQNPDAKTKYVFSEKSGDALKEVLKTYSIYKPIIPVLAHNARGYDSHLIIKYVNERYKEKTINCIPNNMEKYMMFEIGNLRFLDSMQFLMGSLDSHITNLIKAENAAGASKLKNFCKYFAHLSPEALNLIKGKGTFPHDYHTGPEVYLESQLPPMRAFDSYLYNKPADPKEYKEAQKVWDAIECKNFGDYHDNYLVCNVLLLADVFEEFTRASLQDYKLDPVHYFTLPGLAWDAMLLKTKVNLELLSDEEMYAFFDSGVRGGISMISKRKAEANFKRMKDYDPAKPESRILYLDANNLYGQAIKQFLPIGGFKWAAAPETITKEFIMSIPADAQTGYTFEVDLEYPMHLHANHNDLPFCPEKMVAPTRIGRKKERHTKLIPNLRNKTKYVIHYRYLQCALRYGLELTKVHRAISYEQSNWLEQFIDYNTAKRAASTNDFEKEMYKLMNNAVYGKTLENLKKRASVKLINNEKKALKMISRPTFTGSYCIYFEHLVAMGEKKKALKLNNLPYLGQAILNLSKEHMYEFHYGQVRKAFRSRTQLLFTDTDSLCYHFTGTFEEFYSGLRKFLDFSDFPKDHPHFTTMNKLIGKFKDESKGIPFTHFIGLRPKLYALMNIFDKETIHAKGVPKSKFKQDDQSRNEIRYKSFKAQLEGAAPLKVRAVNIRSREHVIHTEEITKVALSADDTKRFILDDGVTTLAHFHKDLVGKYEV